MRSFCGEPENVRNESLLNTRGREDEEVAPEDGEEAFDGVKLRRRLPCRAAHPPRPCLNLHVDSGGGSREGTLEVSNVTKQG